MPKRSFTLACFVVAVVAAFPGARQSPAAALQAKSACGCPDVYDLINRLNMAEAAISALQVQLPQIEAADRRDGKTSSMLDKNSAGQTNQDVLRGAINSAMANVQMRGGQTSAGETGGLCGASVVQSSTKCMDEIVMVHENSVHVPACTRDRAAGKTTAIGFRAPQTTVDYVREEMAGYQAEIARILEILKSLPDSCRPHGWVGMIYYFEEKVVDSSDTVTTSGTFASSSTQTVNIVFKREARILYRETETPIGNVDVQEKATRNDKGTARIACTIGQSLTVPDRTVTRTSEDISEVKGIGEEDVGANFNFDPATGKVALSFEIPGTLATGTLSHSEGAEGECNPAANGPMPSTAASFSTTYGKEPIAFEGVGAGDVDTARGSKTLDLAPSVAVPNVVISHKARVTWALYKID